MSLYSYLYFIILPVLAISVILTFIRFIKGPSVSDRVVSLDLVITICISIITVFSIITNQSIFLDIAIMLGLIAFLSTVGFTYYFDKQDKDV
ncbi:MAG: cation:proton antiporter [Sphingobacteriales bacterium 41-5]|nr:MAG: cation:proton antiporter [Sphingobacteriales bacterium 41-5]